MLLQLIRRGERLLKPVWGRPAVLSLPVVVALVYLGVQHLLLNYFVIALMPLSLEFPRALGLAEAWWHSSEHGRGLPATLALVNLLFTIYLWVVHRSPPGRWWERASTFMLLGMTALFLATQYALYRLLPVPFVHYSVEVIRGAP